MTFASREDAGCRLGCFLRDNGVDADIVLGLPRGGVVVAAAVAQELHLPLDVLVVRKIGHPRFREFAIGAMAEPDIVVLDNESIRRNPVDRFQFEEVLTEEIKRLQDYRSRFHPEGFPDLKGKSVLLIDDGLATGATAEAAVRAIKKQNPRFITVAVPVASVNARERIVAAADQFEALHVDAGFRAVGQYYAAFDQTTDEEVLSLLSNFSTQRNVTPVPSTSNRVNGQLYIEPPRSSVNP